MSQGPIEFLYTLRLLAALLVILCHLSCSFLPELYFQDRSTGAFSDLWLKGPLNAVTNGWATVDFFFRRTRTAPVFPSPAERETGRGP